MRYSVKALDVVDTSRLNFCAQVMNSSRGKMRMPDGENIPPTRRSTYSLNPSSDSSISS